MRLLTTLLLSLAWLLPAEAGPTAIRAGKLLTGTGKVLTNATIWVDEKGVITAIDQRVPGAGVTVIDHGKATIIPGLVAATSQMAIDGGANDQSSEVTPAFRIASNLDGSSRSIRRALQLGLTTVYVRPGLDNVIGGFGAVVRPGATGKAFVVRPEHDLVVACGPWPSDGNRRPGGQLDNPMARRPTTRMAVVWLIRKSFHDGGVFARTGKVGDLQKEAPGAYTAEELKILAAARSGKQTVRFVARSDKDVRTVFRIAKEFGIPLDKIRIEGVVEGYRGPAELTKVAGLVLDVVGSDPADAAQPINGQPMPFVVAALKAWMDQSHDPTCACCGILLGAAGAVGNSAVGTGDEPSIITPTYGPRANNAAVMISRTSRCAIVTPGDTPDLRSAAGYAIRHGLDEAKALAAITREPARQLGLADQVGTIAVGKRADLVVLNGAPFEVTSRILAVYSDGRRVFDVKELLR